MDDKVLLSRFPLGSLAKLAFLANVGFWIPMGFLFGVLALNGMDTVSWNGQHIHGPGAMIVGPLLTFAFALIGTIVFCLGILITRFIAGFINEISLDLKPTAKGSEGEVE